MGKLEWDLEYLKEVVACGGISYWNVLDEVWTPGMWSWNLVVGLYMLQFKRGHWNSKFWNKLLWIYGSTGT